MAETSHDVRRELEATRERMSDTIAALERKVSPRHWLDEYPLPVLGVAFGAGALLGSTGADRTVARGTMDVVRAQLHSVRDGAEHVMAAVGNGTRRHDGNGHGATRIDSVDGAGTSTRGVAHALGDTVERLAEGVTAALISAATAKLMQFMDRMAGQYAGAPPPGRPYS